MSSPSKPLPPPSGPSWADEAAGVARHLKRRSSTRSAPPYILWAGAGVSKSAKTMDWAQLNAGLFTLAASTLSDALKAKPPKVASPTASFYDTVARINFKDWMRIEDFLADGFGHTPQEVQNAVAALLDTSIRVKAGRTITAKALSKRRYELLNTTISALLSCARIELGTLGWSCADFLRRHSSASAITTNFDTIIEQCYLAAAGFPPAAWPGVKALPARKGSVFHIHGIVNAPGLDFGALREREGLILSDADFSFFTEATKLGSGPWSWADDLARDYLARTTCLFVGTSLSDPNLLRWLSSRRSSGAGRPIYEFETDEPLRLWLTARDGWHVKTRGDVISYLDSL
jgi:hypothetical protein